MALLLCSLGHVLHLNQDLSQPDHTRNDNHYDQDRHYIEGYGTANYPANPAWFAPQPPHGWPYWQAQGFNKLLDFWDRGLYNGQRDPLNNDAGGTPETKLGLAEFSNGNLLGEDALYNEVVPKGNPFHHFPYPSLETSTKFPLVRQNPSAFVQTSYLKNGKPIKTVTIEKIRDGISVNSHSVLSYLGAKFPRKQTPKTISINDPNVLQEYHSIMLPKAVEYSAGILDYFFRGKLGVCPSFAAGQGQSRLQIQNVSGTSFQAGAFHLLWDDSTGNRTELQPPDFTTPDYNGALADGATTTARFTAQNNAVSYTLVYQGSVGTSDPVDADIAVASAKILPNRWGQLAWGTPFISATGTGTASFTPSGATGASFDAAASGLDDFFGVFPGSGGGGAENTGTLSYRGNALCCNLHLVCDKDTIDSCAGVSVQGINGLYVGHSFNYNEAGGTLDLPFTIPDTQGQTDTISVYVICEAPCSDGESGQAVHVHFSGTFGP